MNHPGLFVGLIPDKNRTWTKKHFRTEDPTLDQYLEGYFEGSRRVKNIITLAREIRLGIISLWGMSGENMLYRGASQKSVLFHVFHHHLVDLKDNFMFLPENEDVRFVHMGRRDRLEKEAPDVIELIDEITNDTRHRTGMVVAVALDYDGRDEQRRATELWEKAGRPDGEEGIKYFLDLTRQGIDFRPADLILRTGYTHGQSVYTNEFLYPYLKETRVISNTVFIPDYSEEMCIEDLTTFGDESQNRGA